MVYNDKTDELAESKKPRDKWLYWDYEIGVAKTYRKDYDLEVEKYQNIYENLAAAKQDLIPDHKYPIFWANIQTLKPLVYSNLPLADIRRRYASKDAVARLSCILLERSTNFFTETGKLSDKLLGVRDSGLIRGLGNLKVRLVTEIVETESFGEQEASKRIEYDYVDHNSFLCNPATTEDMIRWKAYLHHMDKYEIKSRFGKKIAENIKFTKSVTNYGATTTNCDDAAHKRAEVWEIWHKDTGKVIFWSDGYTDALLSEEDDTYNLEGFFPSPPSLNFGRVTTSTLPIPPFRMYKTQAQELNNVCARIQDIINQIKAGGLYNAVIEQSSIENHLNNDSGEFSPIKIDPSVDINKLIYNKDIQSLAAVLQVLRSEKEEIINDIRDITGISDIVRGTSIASETATAQKIKGNFAISRIQPYQEEMSRFIRDIIRITAELVAENYSGEELAQISGMRILEQAETNRKINEIIVSKNLSPEEAKQVKQVMLDEQDKVIKLEMAVTDEMLAAVDKMLKDDKLRGYAIDIESETTVQVDSDKLKQERIEFLNVMSGFIQQYAPLVQGGLIPREAFTAILGFVSRPFKVGRELEEAFEMMGEQPQEEEQPQAPSEADINAQLKNRDLDIKEFKVKSDVVYNQEKVKLEALKIDASQFDKEADREANFQNNRFKKLAEDAKFSKQAQEQIQ